MQRSGAVLVTEFDKVRELTLNRPDSKNAFDDDMHQELVSVLTKLDNDSSIRALVLTGAGNTFSAGGSLEDFDAKRLNVELRQQSLRTAQQLVDLMVNLRLPIVAAVNGPAVGLGCTLVTLCDIVFIADNTFLCDPHVAVALVAGDGSAVTWPHLTSLNRAKQFLLTGDRIPAAEAQSLGLVNFVTNQDLVLSEARKFAQRLAALSPQAVQGTKAILNQHLRNSASMVLAHGLALEMTSHDSPEFENISTQNRH